METLTIRTDNKEQLNVIKAFLESIKVKFELSADVTPAPLQSVADDIREALEEVKLHQEGKIKLKGIREVLDEL